MANSLWPDVANLAPPRGTREMLHDAAGDIDAQTKGAIKFYVDTLRVSGESEKIRHNCYLHVASTGYSHLLFRVTTPGLGPWPASASTPEGETFPDLQDEGQLRLAIEQILQRDRTKEILAFLLNMVR